MKGKRVLLHFGGVDYKTWVYVNGKLAGTHTGENAAFCFEITPLLREGGNELVVRVFDDLRSGLQVGGKQSSNKSEGCLYTGPRASGSRSGWKRSAHRSWKV